MKDIDKLKIVLSAFGINIDEYVKDYMVNTVQTATEALATKDDAIVPSWGEHNVNQRIKKQLDLDVDTEKYGVTLVDGYDSKPNVGDLYWCIDDVGAVDQATWLDDNEDFYRLTIGNIYKSKEDGQYAIKWQTALANIERDAPRWSIKWENSSQGKWGVYYDHPGKKLDCTDWSSHQHSILPSYESEEQALKSIANHEADFKILFGVE